MFYIPIKNENTELFQTQEFQQFNTIPDPQQVTTMLQNLPYPSEIATIQNVSELFDETINNPQSITITNDSNINQLPVHNITQNPINDQTLNDAIQNTNQDKTFTYPYQILLLFKHFKHNKTHYETMTHLLFLHNILLKLLHIILLNRDLLIPKPQIQYNFKQQRQQHNQIYQP